MRIFDRNIEPGRTSISAAFIWRGIRKMARAWEGLSVHQGRVDWQQGTPKIIMDPTALGVPIAEYFEVTSITASVLKTTHKVRSGGAWIQGSLGTNFDIYPHPEVDIARYDTDMWVAAVEKGDRWYALRAPDGQISLTVDDAEVLIEDVTGPTLSITGTAGNQVISLVFRKRKLDIKVDDVTLGTAQSADALTVAITSIITSADGISGVNTLIANGDLTAFLHENLGDIKTNPHLNEGHDGRYLQHENSPDGNPTLESLHTGGRVTTTEILTDANTEYSGDKATATDDEDTYERTATSVSFNGERVLRSRRTMDAYTSDPESDAYEAADPEADDLAKLNDINALRTAYENLRLYVEDLRDKVILETNGHGLASE